MSERITEADLTDLAKNAVVRGGDGEVYDEGRLTRALVAEVRRLRALILHEIEGDDLDSNDCEISRASRGGCYTCGRPSSPLRAEAEAIRAEKG